MLMTRFWNYSRPILFRFGAMALGGIVLLFVMCVVPPFDNFIYCLKMQAYLGSTNAMLKLVETDIQHNYYWLVMAANRGNTNAIFGVGNLNRPKPEALKWYKKGAALGSIGCTVEVGKAFQYGLYGEDVNMAEAQRWYDKAIALELENKQKH